MSARHGRRWLAAILAGHILIGLVYLWATPIFEASDEGSHYGVIHWIASGHGLPVQDRSDPRRETPYHQEGSQPPLYYLLSAGLTFWMPTDDYVLVSQPNPLSQVGYVGAAHNVNLYRPAPPGAGGETERAVTVIRLFSLLLSCATVAATEALARRAGAGQGLALMAAALAAFNPMALFINASINNDNLLMLLSALVLVWALALAQGPAAPAVRRLAGLGALLGLAALTKVSGLVLWPVAGLALAWGEWRRAAAAAGPGQGRLVRWLRGILPQAGVVAALAVVVSGWWFLRNQQLYGEWLGLETMVAVAGPRQATLWQLITQEWYGFYLSFWGIFGAFTLLPGLWTQWLFHVITVGALAGGALAVVRRRGRLTFEAWWLIGFCLLTLAGVVRWTMTTPASQGRLLFGALAPLSLGLAAGLAAWAPPRFRLPAGQAVGAALAAAAALIPIQDLAPRYRPPAPLAESELPGDLRRVGASFQPGLELVGYTFEDDPRRPGEFQRVTLYWNAHQSMDRDYALALVVTGRAGEVVGKVDTWPGAGRLPTANWLPGAYYADPYDLPIAAQAEAPTRLNLRLGLWDGRPDERLPAHLEDGSQTDAVVLSVGRLIPSSPAAAQPAVQAQSQFEHGLQLLGYTADWDRGASTLALTLFWQAPGPLPADYTIFLHLVDAAGKAVAPPADAPPLSGDWPTTAWLPGQRVVDPHLIPLPRDLPAACCDLQLGWYDPASGARLLAYQPDGTPWPDGTLVLSGLLHP